IFFFQAEDGIRDKLVTGVQTCALPILKKKPRGVRMTSHNQQPQGPSPFDQQPERPITLNSSWTTTQPINTKSTPPQQTILPEQKIGRASCRERVKIKEDKRSIKKKDKK